MTLSKQIILLSLSLCFGIAACIADKAVNKEKLNNSMTDDAYIFFKNMRQTYYSMEDMPDAGIRIYRNRKNRPFDTTKVMLNVAIVVNWKMNKAYLALESSPLLGDEIHIKWTNEDHTESGKYLISVRNQANQMDFATDIYHGILKEYQFQLLDNRQDSHSFLDDDQRDAFRITMKDFYRLTGAL